MSAELAIIIPAWKTDYLEMAINSVLQQTDSRYQLYVFDDGSPHNIRQIIEGAGSSARIKYHRFDENMGQKSLVAHWNRCISQTNNEKWIWLFSDDDLMDPTCVEAFHKTQKQYPNRPAYRFQSKKISGDGETIRENHFPDEFAAADFLNIKLSYSQESYIVEYIFSRDLFHKMGGIPALPLAWASDDLFIAKLAGYGSLRTIAGPYVHWRYSGSNISGKKSSRSAPKKMEACYRFVTWIKKKPELAKKLAPSDLPVRWYIRQIRTLQGQLTLAQEWKAVFKLGGGRPSVWKHYFSMKKERSKYLGWLRKFSS